VRSVNFLLTYGTYAKIRRNFCYAKYYFTNSYAENSFRGHAGFFNADISMHRLKIMEKKSIKLNLTNTVLQNDLLIVVRQLSPYYTLQS